MKVRFTNGIDNDTKGYVDLNEILSNICDCVNPKIHTDKNGINYCKKCKVEVEILTLNK